METRRSISMFDIKTFCEGMHTNRQETQSDLSVHRPSMLRFVLTPLTVKERCRIVRDQLEQLQYEHGQLLSLTGEQTGNENMEELQAEAGHELGLRQPGQIAEEKPMKEFEVERTRQKEVESASENILQDMRTLERETSICNHELEKETLQLQAEQQIHERLTSQIQSCQQRTSNSTHVRELRKNADEMKDLIGRLRDENTNLAGYILRKRNKLSVFQRLRRWMSNLNCFHSQPTDDESSNKARTLIRQWVKENSNNDIE